jgi:hemolysin activation/secretion protein
MMDVHTKELFVFLFVGLVVLFAQGSALSSESATTEPEANAARGTENEQEISGESVAENEVRTNEPNLPIDFSARVTVRELVINGNTLISTKTILKQMPEIYNRSNKPLNEAPSDQLYDFRRLRDLIEEPNQPQEISGRTIEGLIQYILSLYQKKNYVGIYVYLPEGTLIEGEGLKDDILHVEVLEIPVSEVSTKFYNATDQNEVEKSYLRSSAVLNWSPVKSGQVINEKKLDEYVNLLNLNPDRHVYSMISKGSEPNTLSLSYDIYEANPWHFFVQVDNSGTHDRQWTPRVGFINTSLLGFDDRFTVLYQAKPDATFQDNYSVYGSYDVPVMGPKLRMNLFGGHSEFDIVPDAGPFNFLGRGNFYGGLLRYNLYQVNDWFLYVSGSYSNERSEVTPSLFPAARSDVTMDLVGMGAELSRENDRSSTSLAFGLSKMVGGSSEQRFNLARTNAEPYFNIYTLSANYSQYLDKKKYEQLRSTARWITSDKRLVPAKMTSFGGMYSVRGYKEYEIVADGGILASVQCEFDWLKYQAATETAEVEDANAPQENQATAKKSSNFELRKLSPLLFFDYGRATIKDPVVGERKNTDLYSVGVGLDFAMGRNFSGACYYGVPLRSTEDTTSGHGRVSAGFMLRW